MTPTQAIRYLVAAGDDLALAAWSYIIDENKLPPSSDVSPCDHAAAIDAMYLSGAISATAYNEALSSGIRPSGSDIQMVLDAVRILAPAWEKYLENNMSNKPNAITRRNSAGGGLPKKAPKPKLGNMAPTPTTSSPAPPMPPSQGLSSAPPPRTSLGQPPQTQEHPGLPCTNPAVSPEGQQLFCCGTQVQLSIDSEDQLGPDDIGESVHEDVSLIERVFYGECSVCGSQLHISIGRAISINQIG